MRKYIDADELKKSFSYEEDAEYSLWTLAGVIGEIDDIEAADVQEVVKEWCNERNCIIVAREDFPRLEVRHGKKKVYYHGENTFSYVCDQCAMPIDGNDAFCRWCGAKIDEVEK